MNRPSPASDPYGRDGLEPPHVAAGRLLFLAAAVFAALFCAAAALWGAYRWRVGHSQPPVAVSFPAPELETNQTPRATLSTSHGPGPYRLKPPQLRTGQAAPAQSAIDTAMRAVVGRGAQAYDPVTTPMVGS